MRLRTDPPLICVFCFVCRANGNSRSQGLKQEIHNAELEDSFEELLVTPNHLKNSKNKKPHSPKVTFQKEIETAKLFSEGIGKDLKVVCRNNGDSNNVSIEMLSPLTQQTNGAQFYEIIVGSKSLPKPVSISENKPQTTGYKCDICSTDLGNVSALTAHKKKEHPDTKMRCPDPTCDSGVEFNTTAQLDEHYKKKHGLKCTMCDRIYLSISSLNRHLSTDHEGDEAPGPMPTENDFVEAPISSQDLEHPELEASQVCWICGAVVKNNVYLDRHIVSVHWEKKHVCVICDKRFPTELALKKHVRIHDPNHKMKRFFCQHCPKSFRAKYYLKEHLLVHASLKPHVCETCGHSFIRKRGLVRHRDMRNTMGFCPKPKRKKSESSLNTDNSNRPDSPNVLFTSNVPQEDGKQFECDVCKRKFIRKINRDSHMKYHFCNGDPEILKKLLEEPEIQECGICKRVLLSKRALQLHVSGHTNSSKPFQCDFCDKCFSFSNEYRVHERLHTGETPYQCSHCSQRFRKRSHLVIHESKHSDDKSFACPICQKTFKRRKLLLNHTFTHKGKIVFIFGLYIFTIYLEKNASVTE